ncbi:hypothetical protein [Brucella pseudintermedia]|uniref:hypothetical protein n=1 Tax=Brucella pseudintermedia TaxID=370111 RepID=UPI0030F45064
MTDLCSLHSAIHDIRQSTEILETLADSVADELRMLRKWCRLPDDVGTTEKLLQFEISRQLRHCCEAGAVIATLQDHRPANQPEPRVIYRNMGRDDFKVGATIMMSGKLFEIGRYNEHLSMWDLYQDGELAITMPEDRLIQYAWVQGAKRH